MKKVLTSFVTVVFCFAMILPVGTQAQQSSNKLTSDSRATPNNSASRPEASEGEFFIAFRDRLEDGDIARANATGARVTGRFPEVRAMAIKINNDRQLDALANNPRVEYVEAVPMRYKSDLSSSQLAPSTSNGLYGLLTTKATTVHARNASPAQASTSASPIQA
jgi:hypothetical protein